MDIYSLAATQVHAEPRPAPMKARAEDRYYANQIAPPFLQPGLVGSIAMIAGMILLLCTSQI
jgi:hypothetical protein